MSGNLCGIYLYLSNWNFLNIVLHVYYVTKNTFILVDKNKLYEKPLSHINWVLLLISVVPLQNIWPRRSFYREKKGYETNLELYLPKLVV